MYFSKWIPNHHFQCSFWASSEPKTIALLLVRLSGCPYVRLGIRLHYITFGGWPSLSCLWAC